MQVNLRLLGCFAVLGVCLALSTPVRAEDVAGADAGTMKAKHAEMKEMQMKNREEMKEMRMKNREEMKAKHAEKMEKRKAHHEEMMAKHKQHQNKMKPEGEGAMAPAPEAPAAD